MTWRQPGRATATRCGTTRWNSVAIIWAPARAG